MFTISKRFDFSASHQLKGLSEDHPCSRLHGHNYSVIITLQSESLSPVGFVWDYRDLSGVKEFIDQELDHRHLNDIVTFNPTSENLAQWFFEQFTGLFVDEIKLKSITVKETDKTTATYET